MRDDQLVLNAADVAWFVSALEFLEKLAIRARMGLPPSVAATKNVLAQHLSRVGGRADATPRPVVSRVVDPEDEWIDTATAAEHLGLTEEAVRKACRTGRFTGVARKHHGRWCIPQADIEAVRDRKERTA